MVLNFRTEEERALYEQISRESELETPVKSSITCHHFVSRSKGRRNGRQRIRRTPKEVNLVSHYRRFYQLDLAPLDQWVTEVFQGVRETTRDLDADYLREQIKTEFNL